MKTKRLISITILAMLILSLSIHYGCKKEKINAPPTISITSPVNGTSITLGTVVPILVKALDSDGTITSVSFFIDGTSKSSDANAPYNYEWNTANIEAGSHIIKATATDNEGISVSAEVTVSLGNLPVTDFSASKTNDTIPLTVNFTDLSTKSPTSWVWVFGDGGTSTEQNPTHIYDSVGTFTVTLTATNEYGSDTEVKTDYIIGGSVVAADFNASITDGIAPLAVDFTDLSTQNPTSWLWDFGDGGTSSEQNPHRVYTIVGSYTVGLTATNEYGSDIKIKNDYIIVGAIPEADFTVNTTNGIVPLTVNFTDVSTFNPTSWLWDFGDGGTSTEQNPSHTYNEKGTYTVTLTATNKYGSDTEIKNNYIISGSIPIAEFTASSTYEIVPLTVNFTDQSSNNGTSWSWDFGDGGTSSEQNPSYIYNEAGKYTVTLTVTNEYGSDTETKEDFINVVAPAPDLSIIDISEESEWEYLVLGKEDYYFINANNSKPQSVLYHSKEADKDYSILISEEGLIDKVVIDNHILVFTNYVDNKVDIGVIYPNGEIEIIRGVEANFDISSLTLKSVSSTKANSDIVRWSGRVVGALPCIVSLAAIPATVGFSVVAATFTCGSYFAGLASDLMVNEYEVHNGFTEFMDVYGLSSTGISCVGSLGGLDCATGAASEALSLWADHLESLENNNEKIVESNNLLRAPVTNFFADKTYGDAPLVVNFTDLTLNGPTSWQWSFGDGSSSTEQNPSHTYQEPGLYSVSLTAKNEYGSHTELKTVYIQVVILPVADFTASPRTGAAPLTVNFTDQSLNDPTFWLWKFGDGIRSTEQNPSHTYTDAGIYTVELQVENNYAADREWRENYIIVGATPVASFVANTTSGGAPLTVNFTDQSTNSPTSWLWSFGDGGTSTSQNPSHTYSSAGTYTVSLTATNAYGSNTKTRTSYISVGNKPVANFAANKTSGTVPLAVSFTDQSTNNPTSWSWNFGDGGTATSQNPSHTYSSAGTYTVSLTATNAYGSGAKTRTNYITSSSTPVVSLPTVTTTAVSSISQTTATSGGNVTSDGNATVTARGVCWSTSASPTTANSKTTNGTGTGTFTSSLTGLTASTLYYVRAYATNSQGTVYGEQKQFTTSSSSSSSTGTFTDARDGKTYKTVTIGSQTWMAENLAYLPAVSPSSDGSSTAPYYYVYGYEGTSVSSAKATANYTTYGVLYNWSAASTSCPSGWHLPSDAEWTTLITYLGGKYDAGRKLKEAGTAHWLSTNTDATNDTGFTALPGGLRYFDGVFGNIGYTGNWWSSTESSSVAAWRLIINWQTLSKSSYAGSSSYSKTYGCSIRCVKD